MDFIYLVLGFVLLIKGADWLVGSASKLAKSFGVSSLIIGLSVVAFGTSAPESAIGILSGIKHTNQITLGDVVGSSIANIALIIGVTALLSPLAVEKSLLKRELPMSFGIQALFFVLAAIGGIMARIDGIILLLVFLLFLYYLWRSAKHSSIEAAGKNGAQVNEVQNIEVQNMQNEVQCETQNEAQDAVQSGARNGIQSEAQDQAQREAGYEAQIEFQNGVQGEARDEEKPDRAEDNSFSAKYRLRLLLIFGIGLAFLIIGGNIVVDSSVSIAHTFGLSEALIGVTIVALGTSLPELVTCIIAAIRKESDIATGNIIGSNIFNILFVLGLSSVINPIRMTGGVYVDSAVMLLATLLLFGLTVVGKKVTRPGGTVLCVFYIAFIVYKVLTV